MIKKASKLMRTQTDLNIHRERDILTRWGDVRYFMKT